LGRSVLPEPLIRDLAEAKPDEIWVIQIDPEERRAKLETTAEIEDRRNELSGNTSLNQELYFVRKINELVK
jgi:NTE family protein